MPNYARTTNPWLEAANGIGQGTDRLAQMWMQLPQIRAQMQHQADQLGLQQANLGIDQQRLGLQQLETQARLPVWQGEAANQRAMAMQHAADADAQTMQTGNAVDAGLAMFAKSLLESGVQQDPRFGGGTYRPDQASYLPATPENLLEVQNAQIRQMREANGNMSPASAARLAQPNEVNQNAALFGAVNNALLAQGQRSSPLGNTVALPTTGGVAGQVVQQGQFRPTALGAGRPAEDPTLAIQRLAGIKEKSLEVPPELDMLLGNLIQQALYNQTNQPQPWMKQATSAAPIKVNTKEEHAKLPKGTQYIGPDGKLAIKQ